MTPKQSTVKGQHVLFQHLSLTLNPPPLVLPFPLLLSPSPHLRLEQRNEALQGEMAVLRANLTQQRRWHSVAEIKIRNVERARSDADRRNATLQREMEQFFETFGDLSAEARKAERIVQSF